MRLINTPTTEYNGMNLMLSLILYDDYDYKEVHGP